MTQKIANCHYLYSSARPETMFSSVRSLICYQTWKRDVLKTSKPTLTEISSSGTRDKSTKWSTFGVRGRLANRTGSSRNWPTMSRVPCEAHFVPENGNVKIDHRAWIYGCSLMNVLYFVFVSHTRLDLTWVLCLYRKFKFILMKMHTNCCHQSCSFWLICTKSFVGWGFAPDPNGGAYSAPQTL